MLRLKIFTGRFSNLCGKIRGFSSKVLDGYKGIENTDFSIYPREDGQAPNEYHGSLGGRSVSIYHLDNWSDAEAWLKLSEVCSAKYILQPLLIHEVRGDGILVFTQRVDRTLTNWFEKNSPLVDSTLGFINPSLRYIYRDITEAMLHVYEHTNKCHGNITSQSIKLIGGRAFLSCPLAFWDSEVHELDSSMFQDLLRCAHPEGTPEETVEVTYFIKGLDGLNRDLYTSKLRFLIGYDPIFKSPEEKMELWLFLSRILLEFQGKNREKEVTYIELCNLWDKEYGHVVAPDWRHALSNCTPSVYRLYKKDNTPKLSHSISLLVEGRNAAEHNICDYGEMVFISHLTVAWRAYLPLILALAYKHRKSKFVARPCGTPLITKPETESDLEECKTQQRDFSMSLEDKYETVRSVSIECIQEDELISMLDLKPEPIAYDRFEPSGRIDIAQVLMKTINVNKMTSAGCKVKIWIADLFAEQNNKMEGDWKRIQTVGRYMIEILKAVGMNLDNGKVEFLWSSKEISERSYEYWHLVMDIAQKIKLEGITRSSQIMGCSEQDDLTLDKILQSCMKCADIFLLQADICHMGMDQRKMMVLARQCSDDINTKNKPIILLHHMLLGLQHGQEKMSKSDVSSSIFMEDEEAEVNLKIMKAYCPPNVVEGNPCMEYVKYLILPWFNEFTVECSKKNGGNKTFKNFEKLAVDYESGELHPDDLKSALSKALNKILEPVRKHFKNDRTAKRLLERVKHYGATM